MEMISSKDIKKNKKKQDCSYAWIALVLACLFWVPFLNIILFLPASIYFGIRAIKEAKKNPKKYGGHKLGIFCIIWASLSLIFSIIVLVLIINGEIGA